MPRRHEAPRRPVIGLGAGVLATWMLATWVLATGMLLSSFAAPPAAASESGGASSDAELFVQANTAYEQGNYPEAIRAYESLLSSPPAWPFAGRGALFYNLGNAHLRNGDLGRAVAAYRRAHALLPRDEDIAANLAFARRAARDALAPPDPRPAWVRALLWSRSLSFPELLGLVLFLHALLWGLAATRLLFPRKSVVAAGLRWGLAGVGVILLLLAGSLALRWAAPPRVAVILAEEVLARTEPNVVSAARFSLHAGSEVRVEEVRPRWVRISLPRGEPGWVPKEKVDIVEE